MAHRCSSVDPDDGFLLRVGQFFINVNTLLQVEQQGYAGHKGEHGVQADSERIELCLKHTKERLIKKIHK